MAFIKFQDKPGVYPDDTALTAAMFYTGSDGIRWERGKWQTRLGWERTTDDTFLGMCRGLFVWRNNQAQPHAALGTHLRAYAYFDADLYDTTPVISRAQESISFTTTIASAVVTMTRNTHGLVADQMFTLANPSVTTVGGVTIAGTYVVLSVTDANNIRFTAAQTASASAGPTASTCDYFVFLAPGLVDGLAGAGFGVGAWDVGDYGEASDIDAFYPRTWTFDNWGQNLLANPRGGGISEWAPAYTATELVTNGTFAVDANWTKGLGWTIAAGVATGAAGNASDLSQSVTMPTGAWCLLVFDYTRTAGTLQPKVNGVSLGSALSAASGRVFLPFFSGVGGAQTVLFHKDATFIGTVDNASVKQIVTLEPIPEAPTQNTCMVVTAEDMVMVGGTIDEDTGEFDPLLVRWCARRNNRLWTPGFEAGNTSGKYRLAKGSRIVRIVNGRGEIVILTDDGFYVVRFNPDPTVNYSFTHMGSGKGLIGPNAVTYAGDALWWVVVGGSFARYAGGSAEDVLCTVQADFFENLAPSQHDKIYLSGIETKKEFQVLYADFRDGNECSRYKKYNWQEDAWDEGLSERTAWVDDHGFGFPLGAGTDALLYFQEKGKSADGGPMSGFIESGAFSLKDGSIAALMGIIPDFEGLEGTLQMTVKTYLYPSSPVTISGPFTITAETDKIDIRTQGRQIAIRYDWTAAPMFARSGTMQGDILDTRSMR